MEGLKDVVVRQYDSIQCLQFEQMRQEHYSLKTSFCIFGIEEEESKEIEDKTISMIKDEIKVKVNKNDFKIVQRVG